MISGRGAWSHLTPQAFAAGLDHLDDSARVGWLRENRDAVLEADVLLALLDDAGADVEDAVVALSQLPEEVVAQLCHTRRAVAAREVARRGDLTSAQLRELLTRDDVKVSRAVWDHPACTDELRGLILSGRTMNPRARSADKLVAVPGVSLDSEQLRRMGQASADPRVLLRAWPDDAGDAALVEQATRVCRALLEHMDTPGPYRGRALARTLRDIRQRLDRNACSTALRQALDAAKPANISLYYLRADGVQALLEALSSLGDLDGDEPAPIDRQAVAALLRSGDAADHVGELTDLCGVDEAELPDTTLVLLAQARPELLSPAKLLEVAATRVPGTSSRNPLNRAGVLRLVEAGAAVPATAVGAVAVRALGTAVVLEHLVPAAAVLSNRRVRMTDEQNRALGTVVSRVLGDDPQRWATFAALVEDFEGSVSELLHAVGMLADGQMAQLDAVCEDA